MTVVERIQRMLDMDCKVPVKDEAGVITPHGIDSSVRRKALEDCLKVAKEVECSQSKASVE
jgi:hypothetical protein